MTVTPVDTNTIQQWEHQSYCTVTPSAAPEQSQQSQLSSCFMEVTWMNNGLNCSVKHNLDVLCIRNNELSAGGGCPGSMRIQQPRAKQPHGHSSILHFGGGLSRLIHIAGLKVNLKKPVPEAQRISSCTWRRILGCASSSPL